MVRELADAQTGGHALAVRDVDESAESRNGGEDVPHRV